MTASAIRQVYAPMNSLSYAISTKTRTDNFQKKSMIQAGGLFTATTTLKGYPKSGTGYQRTALILHCLLIITVKTAISPISKILQKEKLTGIITTCQTGSLRRLSVTEVFILIIMMPTIILSKSMRVTAANATSQNIFMIQTIAKQRQKSTARHIQPFMTI